MSNNVQQELIAKRARLEQLKRQRALRQQEFSQHRSTGNASEVQLQLPLERVIGSEEEKQQLTLDLLFRPRF